MRRGLLIVDRGSREQEAKNELDSISRQVKRKGGYDYCGYCFLEVVPPYIVEGVATALGSDLDELVIVPYFLYPGRKVKAAVTGAMKLQAGTDVRFLITRPMRMHRTMIDLVDNRIAAALSEANLSVPGNKVDVLVIGHGSVDPNAQMSMRYVIDGLQPRYRSVSHCFLEMEKPDIADGVEECRRRNPGVLVIVFYFLHEGAHVKRDIYGDLNPALREAGLEGALITRHIGADEMMVDLILERAREVENADKKRPVD